MDESKILICQCSGLGKVIDATNIQKATLLLIEADKVYKQSKQLQEISTELTLSAIDILLKEGLDISEILGVFKIAYNPSM